ncbi:hypothetical protein Pla163_21960 [Planctomycetes bacterium Pla163]|uniref:Phytase-like domain-containing protein n=2 Tax=Rohdeia mirabilis TaxID=2528008 RepID=A0A518D0R1_9BACT|nr:hypothetical protein Pla163_21960 [Planctomycetes bacterium Pla163]
MAKALPGWEVSSPLLTIGETLTGTTGALNPSSAGSYTPVGVLDGLAAYRLNKDTVRVFANHELLSFRGNSYEVGNGQGGVFTMTGARVSYFDIDRATRQIVDGGLAFDRIYDANGDAATDTSFLTEGFGGLGRLCSANLVEGGKLNFVDTIFFTGEEDGTAFNPIGGAEWALDADSGDLWQLPWLGRGAWENVTPLNAKKFNNDLFPQFPFLNKILNKIAQSSYVAVALSDDSSPFDFDGDGIAEAAPMFLYVGKKYWFGDFVERNGLAYGDLYVWVAKNGARSPLDFNGSGTLKGSWVQIDNSPNMAAKSVDGSTGYDEFGFPTQANLWLQADALGAFQFSRPEDVAVNPHDRTEFVLASTGVDDFAVDPVTGDGVDTFGTLYSFDTNFKTMKCKVTIIYDGDADPTRALRSPDNLEWSADGMIYVQEDRAETDTLASMEPLFGPGAVNPNEAGIVRVDPTTGATERIVNIDRSVVLDGSLLDPTLAVDVDAGVTGAWESSGIVDVSKLFGEDAGTLFLFDVQAHGLEDQEQFNPSSRLRDDDLVEGGQLLFLEKKSSTP